MHRAMKYFSLTFNVILLLLFKYLKNTINEFNNNFFFMNILLPALDDFDINIFGPPIFDIEDSINF